MVASSGAALDEVSSVANPFSVQRGGNWVEPLAALPRWITPSDHDREEAFMPKKDKDVVAPEIIADDLSIEEIADHLAKTLVHTASTEALWPGLISLPAGDRTGNLGKLVAQLSAPLQHLCTALTPKAGEDQQTRRRRPISRRCSTACSEGKTAEKTTVASRSSC